MLDIDCIQLPVLLGWEWCIFIIKSPNSSKYFTLARSFSLDVMQGFEPNFYSSSHCKIEVNVRYYSRTRVFHQSGQFKQDPSGYLLLQAGADSRKTIFKSIKVDKVTAFIIISPTKPILHKIIDWRSKVCWVMVWLGYPLLETNWVVLSNKLYFLKVRRRGRPLIMRPRIM